MITISHPTGNQNVRNASEAFYRANKLARFFTTISWNSHSLLSKALPTSLVKNLIRREYTNIPANLITTYSTMELFRLLTGKLKLKSLIDHETGLFSVDAVYRSFDRHVARQLMKIPDLTQVYAYEDGALETFKSAKELNIETIYELPIGYWRAAKQIMEEEAELKPEWANTILSRRDSDKKLAKKDQELELADKIIVASQFVADTLKLSNALDKEIIIIPYGSPQAVEQINLYKNKTLKVLFVGGLSQRKGLSYLFDAASILKDKISLTIIGNKVADCPALEKELIKYRYISNLPHSQILQEMYQHDILIFPSFFEGFGLVILEAMAQGIPVITTRNTAGPELITDGEDGYILPLRSVELIAEKLELLANDPYTLNKMKIAALGKAKQFSWKRYQTALVQNVIK